MDFNIRAISVADSISADARVVVRDLLGKHIEFRSGITIGITLPTAPETFRMVPEPERLLVVFDGWVRLYRFPDGEGEALHVLAPAEDEDSGLLFYRIDLHQPRWRRGLRPPVEILGGEVMSFDDCAKWLIDLTDDLSASPNEKQRQVILARPRLPRPTQMRLAWVGPELVDGSAMHSRLQAIGRVYGAEIILVPPRQFREVKSQLSKASPLNSVVICERFVPYITVEAVPEQVPQHLIHFCRSHQREELEDEVRAWIGMAEQLIAKRHRENVEDEEELLLVIMLRGMLSHSKIGPFNHCQKETVLKGIRARHLNASAAESILDLNTELHRDKHVSGSLFLYKDHNDGRQYFLNPRCVEDIKSRVRNFSESQAR
jgi:hypothetical protein